MPGYTSEEVQAAVDQFLLGTVTTPRTNLGVRDVLAARDDIYALLTTTLLLRPDSYFYVIWLAKNRLEALRRQQAAALSFILDPSTLSALRRRGAPVTSTVELTNAQAALLNVNAGLNAGQGVQTRNLGPEVDRFRSSIDSFIKDQIQTNVVSAGVVTETAGETRDKIATTWAAVKTRHAQMLTLCEAIRDAIVNLNSVKLPEMAVATVVTRLRDRLDSITTELENDKTLTTHREAMLELLTMRTLLTRVSAFRTPQEVLAPLAGDATQLTGVGGLTPASILGTISGPFSVPPAATLDLQTGSPVVPSVITIGPYSNAETASRQFTTLPIVFPVGAELRLRVNGTLFPADSVTFSGASFASVALFLTAIQGYLTTNVVPATASSVGSQVVIRSTSFADVSSIEVLTSTVGQQAFVTTAAFTPIVVCRPVEASVIVAAGVSFPGVLLSEVRTEYFTGNGRTGAAGLVNVSKISGTVDTSLTPDGLSFTANEALGNTNVRVGDFIVFDPGGVPQYAQIVTVSGAAFTVDTAISNVGLVSYRIGADFRGVPAGTRVLVGSTAVPLNRGPYRITSGDVAAFTVDRSFFVNSDPVSVAVFSSFLRAQAPGATPADGVTAFPASTGATAVGYTPSATQVKAGLTHFQIAGVIDLFARGVSIGDLLILQTSPAASQTTIRAVSIDELDADPVSYFASAVNYTIKSARYVAWLGLVSNINVFLNNVDFDAADFAITRIVSGAAPTTLLGPGGPVDLFSTAISTLGSIQNYVVPFERSVDNILRMLTEQGMDRAVDLFTTLQIVEFFSMHPDGVSYSTNLIRTAADVTRQVAPVSRFAQSLVNSPEVRLRSRRMTTGTG